MAFWLLQSLLICISTAAAANVGLAKGTSEWAAKAVINTSTLIWGKRPDGFSFPNLAGGAVMVSASSNTASELLVYHATTSDLLLHISSSTPAAHDARISAIGNAAVALRAPPKAASDDAPIVAFTATVKRASVSAYDAVVLVTEATPEAILLASTQDEFLPANGSKFSSFMSVASAVLDEGPPGVDKTVMTAFAAEAESWQGIVASEHVLGGSTVLKVVVAVGDAIPGAPHLDFRCVSSPQVSPQGQVVFFGSHCGTNAAESSSIAFQRSHNTFFRTQRWQSHCLKQHSWSFSGLVDHVFPGIYRSSSQLEVVADSNTAMPGGGKGETFSAFSSPAIGAEGTVSFVGLGTNGTMGIFAQANGGRLRSVVTTASTMGSMSFGDFPYVPSVGPDGLVFFYAVSAGGLGGIYAETAASKEDHSVEQLLSASDTLDGQSISFIGFGTAAADAGGNDALAVYLVLGNGTDGIWTLTRRGQTDVEITV